MLVALVGCGEDPASSDGGVPDGEVPCKHAAMDLAVSTLVGCASNGTQDGVRSDARFDSPTNVAIAADGNHNAVSTSQSKTYIYQTSAMTEPEYGERMYVPLT
jgi:hypothetical protein